MKNFILNILFLIPFSLLAQKAEKIVSIAQKHYPTEYYHTQAKLWKKKIDQRSNNAMAWENYYAACRMANLVDKSKTKKYPLDEIVEQAAKKVPNTFEYHRIAYWNNSGDPKYFHHLEKAYELAPERPEMYHGMVSMYDTKRNKAKKKLFCKKMHEVGEYSPGALDWNYNQLVSVEDDAILLTYGDFDTYPSWMLQGAKDIKSDVAVINLNMLRRADYRQQIFKEYNLPALKAYTGEVDFTEMVDFAVALVPHIAQHSRKPIYLGVGCGPAIIDSFDTKLYLVGLAFKYSESSFDNIAVLQSNIENEFAFDQLKLKLYKDKSESLLNRLNVNYLPALVMLHKHYTSINSPKSKNVKELIDIIAKDGGMEAYVEELFK